MSYKYTHLLSKFTKEERDFYEENGYILIKNNVSIEILDKCYKRFVDICEGRIKDYVGFKVWDPLLRNRGVKGQHSINKYITGDKGFWEYISCQEVVDVVENIIGPNITAFHAMVINKPPNSHENISRHPLHQDLYYFSFRPVDTIVTSWTAMEKVDEDNGCLFLIPGSHRSHLYRHDYPEGIQHGFYYEAKVADHLPVQNIVMDKGDSIFFHPLLLHGSRPNHTQGFRKAITSHYADTNSYFIDVTGTSHEKVAREFMAFATSKGMPLTTINDVIKINQRVVRGPPGNFQNAASKL